MGFAEKVTQAVHVAMPVATEIRFTAGIDGLSVYASWPLHHDPARSDKTSKTIRITVKSDTLDELDHETPQRQRDAEANLFELLAFKLHDFEPDRDASASPPAPEDHWIISYRDLLR